jgi:hypothetical protein
MQLTLLRCTETVADLYTNRAGVEQDVPVCLFRSRALFQISSHEKPFVEREEGG